ncbi:MAG: branched-chain amino acid ABC transporter permease [Treponemataceae bacterium]|nr:MAG: branched-chain amino acid ABC transporter permease [Treponemataceae bacterium]
MLSLAGDKVKTKNSNTFFLLVLALVCIFVPAALIYFGAVNGYVARILTIAALNAIMAISVNMICGITGQLSLGQAGFMAIGMYASALLNGRLGVPLFLSIPLAGIIAAFAGFLIGFPTLKLSGDYLAIVTLGFGEIIRVILVNLKSLTGGPNGLQVISNQFMGLGVLKHAFSYIVVSVVLVLVMILLHNFIRSTYGRAVLSLREDEIAAESSGIGIFKYKMLSFVIAAFIAGIAGGIYGPVNNIIKPENAAFARSVDYLIFVVLGGMGSITGSVFAAFVLTSLQEILRFMRDYRLLVYPLILIFVMLFRPQGLFGTKEISVSGIAAFLKTIFAKVTARIEYRRTEDRRNAERSAD